MWTRRGRQKMERLQDAILEHLDRGVATGRDLCHELGVRSGRVYPALTRLLADGRITDEWAVGRRYYRKAQP